MTDTPAAELQIDMITEERNALEAEVRSLTAERDALNRRLYPSQGEEYANEVERQRYVIEELQRIAANLETEIRSLTAERDEQREWWLDMCQALEAIIDAHFKFGTEISDADRLRQVRHELVDMAGEWDTEWVSDNQRLNERAEAAEAKNRTLREALERLNAACDRLPISATRGVTEIGNAMTAARAALAYGNADTAPPGATDEAWSQAGTLTPGVVCGPCRSADHAFSWPTVESLWSPMDGCPCCEVGHQILAVPASDPAMCPTCAGDKFVMVGDGTTEDSVWSRCPDCGHTRKDAL